MCKMLTHSTHSTDFVFGGYIYLMDCVVFESEVTHKILHLPRSRNCQLRDILLTIVFYYITAHRNRKQVNSFLIKKRSFIEILLAVLYISEVKTLYKHAIHLG